MKDHETDKTHLRLVCIACQIKELPPGLSVLCKAESARQLTLNQKDKGIHKTIKTLS